MKNNLLLTAVFFLMTLCLVAQIPTDSLLLYYPFNGDANDETTNALHGTVYGATPTTDRFGNPNRAYFFDGIDDYIELPNSQILKPNLPLSISYWVKLESLKQLETYFFSTSPELRNHAGCQINLTSDGTGRINVNFGDDSGSAGPENRRSKSTNVNLSLGIWYHIVAVYRGQADMDIYINGSKVDGFYTGTGGEIAYTSFTGTIGRHTERYYWGALDDFAYYNTALNSSDVATLFTEKECIETIYDSISVTDTLLIDVVLSVLPPNNINTIKVYPNPTNNIVFINTGTYNRMEDYTIKIINDQGVVVFESLCNQQEFQIDIKAFGAAGLYFVQIIDNNSQIINTKKIILH